MRTVKTALVIGLAAIAGTARAQGGGTLTLPSLAPPPLTLPTLQPGVVTPAPAAGPATLPGAPQAPAFSPYITPNYINAARPAPAAGKEQANGQGVGPQRPVMMQPAPVLGAFLPPEGAAETAPALAPAPGPTIQVSAAGMLVLPTLSLTPLDLPTLGLEPLDLPSLALPALGFGAVTPPAVGAGATAGRTSAASIFITAPLIRNQFLSASPQAAQAAPVYITAPLIGSPALPGMAPPTAAPPMPTSQPVVMPTPVMPVTPY